MLFSRDILRPSLWLSGDAKPALTLLIILLTVAGLAVADEAPRLPTPIAAPHVDWSHARHAYGFIERWVAAGNADTIRNEESSEPPEPIRVSGVSGVRVTLRWAGLTAGVGDDYINEKLVRPGEALDLLASTRAATQRALVAVEQTIIDMRRRAQEVNTTREQISGKRAASQPAPLLSQVGPKLTVDLQIALRLDPIHLPADAPASAIFDRFAPGFHGLRMTRSTAGEPAQSWTWPATALASNITPRSQLVQLLAGVGYDTAQFKMIGRPNGPAIERFEVLHLARASPESPIVQLVRGNVVLPTTSVSAQMLRELTDRLANNLQHRIGPDGTVTGTYQPTSDQFDPPFASDEDAALAAYSLARWANQSRVIPGQPDRRYVQARAAVGKIVDQLTARLHTENNPLDPAASALLLMTVIDSPALGGHKLDRDLIGRRLLAMRLGNGSYRTTGKPGGGGGGAVNAAVGALLTAALSEWFEQTRDPELGRKVCESRDALWANNKPERMVGALPWLMIIEDHRGLLDQLEDSHPATQPARTTAREQASRLRSLMETLRQNQIVDPPALGPADVVGGFELGDSAPDSPPNPDWRSAFVVYFLAAATREPNVVKPSERIDWLLTCALGERFLAQLTFDEPACYYVRSSEDAIGGERLALWDNRLAVAPTAMSLLASLEVERTTQTVAAHPTTVGHP